MNIVQKSLTFGNGDRHQVGNDSEGENVLIPDENKMVAVCPNEQEI